MLQSRRIRARCQDIYRDELVERTLVGRRMRFDASPSPCLLRRRVDRGAWSVRQDGSTPGAKGWRGVPPAGVPAPGCCAGFGATWSAWLSPMRPSLMT